MAVINDNLSLREATGLFNLSSESVVCQWVKSFESSGSEALKSSRGRKKTKMKSTVEQSSSKPLENQTPEDMQAELRYLRAKVEYLKKLKALVQKK